MPFKSRTLQRLFLAFTTGLFLACAARISAANAATVGQGSELPGR